MTEYNYRRCKTTGSVIDEFAKINPCLSFRARREIFQLQNTENKRFVPVVAMAVSHGATFCGLITLILAVFLLGGCGYRFLPAGGHIDPRLETIFIENLVNRTSEAKAEELFRSALIDFVARSGRFRLAADSAQAHLILRGAVGSVAVTPLATGRDGHALEERVTVQVDLSLVQRQDGRVLWSATNIAGNADYRSDRNVERHQINRQEALQRLSRDLSQRSFNLMMSGF